MEKNELRCGRDEKKRENCSFLHNHNHEKERRKLFKARIRNFSYSGA
jgi:hypothetical protein